MTILIIIGVVCFLWLMYELIYAKDIDDENMEL